MDIKIGLVHTPRELTISSNDAADDEAGNDFGVLLALAGLEIGAARLFAQMLERHGEAGLLRLLRHGDVDRNGKRRVGDDFEHDRIL